MMLSKGRVLLVDDEPLVLEMFQSVLSQEGFDVVVASNAKQALFSLEKNMFDAMVADVMLEELDGFDLLNIARRKNPNLAGLLITGAPSPLDAARASAERIHYLSKPVGIDLLLTTVDNAINESRTLRSKLA